MNRSLLLVSALALLAVRGAIPPTPAQPPSVVAEIDRAIRDEFWDPALKGVDWSAAVARATEEVQRARVLAERDAAYDRLLETLADSHTFRLPAGRLPERGWGTAGLRIGRDSGGYAVKAVMPGSSAAQSGLKLGDRILSVDGRAYGKERVNFRDLFLVFEGVADSAVTVVWKPAAGGEPRTSRLARRLEEPGETLVWQSARLIRRGGKAYGYARLWGMSTETALAVVDMLLDRNETARSRPNLAGFGEIEGFLLDLRGNSGGYDPDILATFLRGRWNAGDFYLRTREGRRLVPPEYKPLPVVLLVNAATASAAEAVALQFRRHRIGRIVGETTAGMASGGADARRLSDGSTLWLTARAIEDVDGRSHEGRGVPPDVEVPDRPPSRSGEEEAIVEAGLRALEGRK